MKKSYEYDGTVYVNSPWLEAELDILEQKIDRIAREHRISDFANLFPEIIRDGWDDPIQMGLNWGISGATTPENAINFSKAIAEAVELVREFPYNGCVEYWTGTEDLPEAELDELKSYIEANRA